MKRSVPKLRFKDFDDEWKISNLQQLCYINPKSKGLPNRFKYIDLESIIDGVLVKDKEITIEEAPSRAQRLLNNGDVLFQTVRPYQMNNYIFNSVSSTPSVASTGYAQLKSKEKISNNKFIYQIIHTKKFNNNVMLRCTGTSYPAINSSELATIPLRVPSLQEQEKIANFLTKVDSLIEEQDGKVKDLELYKKGMMQKVFSQEIRFKDHNGCEYPEWEEKKLEKFIVEYTEKTIANNQYPVLTSSRNGLMLQSDYFKDRQVTTDDNTGYFVLPYGYITFRSRSDDGIFVFNQNLIIEKGIISYFYPVFTFNKDLNNYYGITYMNNYLKKEILKEVVGTSQLVLSLNKLKNLKIKLPCLKEQTKIANFLTNIDSIIEQENNKLEDLRQWKKGLLQQMFV